MEKKFEITLGDTRLKSTIPAWQPILDYLEKALNDFLNIAGYTMDKNKVMLISVSDKEYELMQSFLWDIRANNKGDD